MSGISPARKIALLTQLIAGTTYLGLFSQMPNDDGTNGVELTFGDNAYERLAISSGWSSATQPAPSGSTYYAAYRSWPTSAVGVQYFKQCTGGGWAPIVGWGLFSNSSAYVPSGTGAANNLIVWGNFDSAPLLTVAGSQLAFDANHQIIVRIGSDTDVFI